jgi:hypothetical protein
VLYRHVRSSLKSDPHNEVEHDSEICFLEFKPSHRK